MNEQIESKPPWLRPELVAPWWQIIAVIGLLLGQSIYLSSWNGWHGSGRYSRYLHVTYHSLLMQIAAQAWYIAIMLFLLHRLGWKPADFRIKISRKSTAQGVLLTGLEHVAYALGFMILTSLIFGARRLGLSETLPSHAKLHLQVPTGPIYESVKFISLCVNSLREELLCMGYVFIQFAAKRGPLVALILMVILRLSYHTYQGAYPLFTHAIFFTIFGLWYWKTRNLWPLLVAHTLYNFAPVDLFTAVARLLKH